MTEMEDGGVQGARQENWSIIRKQQARENGQNQSKKKRNPRLRGGEGEGDIRMASWRTANEMIDIISKCMRIKYC
jgi:hypothetical protein